ncbi:isochorismatase family protein [Streptomyces sp. NPDC004726]
MDHQPAVALMTAPTSQTELINNVAGLARTAKALDVPTVLTTVGATGSVLADPIFKEISEVFPDNEPIDRVSTNAWSHPDVRAAVEVAGRRELVMADLSTEVCLAQTVLSAVTTTGRSRWSPRPSATLPDCASLAVGVARTDRSRRTHRTARVGP